MRKVLLATAAIVAFAAAGAAQAQTTTVNDPTGDILGSFTGTPDAALDVTSFTVSYDAATTNFMLSATLAGAIDATKPEIYVIGVDTGTGTARPFAGIGEPNVIFNQAIVVRSTGVGAVGANAVTPSITGNHFSVLVPLSLLPSTGFAPDHYGFNLWPRDGLTNNNQIADFAPENRNLAAVPEPAGWALMITGFGLLGGVLRRRQPALKALMA